MSGLSRFFRSRINRSKSHKLLTHLENNGLTPSVAHNLSHDGLQNLLSLYVLGTNGRYWHLYMKDWFKKLGFRIDIPKPNLSTDEQFSRTKQGHVLLYRPPTTQVSYDDYMRACRFSADTSMVNRDFLKNVLRESVTTGYWFWVYPSSRDQDENASEFERLAVASASLEEYVMAASIGFLPEFTVPYILRSRYSKDDRSGYLEVYVRRNLGNCRHNPFEWRFKPESLQEKRRRVAFRFCLIEKVPT